MTAPKVQTTVEQARGRDQPRWCVSTMESRVRAAVMDGVITVIAGSIPGLFLALKISEDFSKHGQEAKLAFSLTLWVAATVYLGFLESRRGPANGQTPGKQHYGIRTVCVRGGLPIGRTRAWIRAGLGGLLLPAGYPLAAIVHVLLGPDFSQRSEMLWAVAGLIIAVATLQPRRRTIFDWICGSAVVDESIVGESDDGPAPLVRPLPLEGLAVERGVLCIAAAASLVGFAVLSMPT